MKTYSRELGLVLLQQLLRLEELHYGLWQAGMAPTLGNLPLAQRHYTEFLLAALREVAPPPQRVLDVGCGSGAFLVELRALGHDAEGVCPAPDLVRMTRERLARAGRSEVRIFECPFEDFPAAERAAYYDALVFSESFQYIALPAALERAQAILRPGGHLLICDFFRSAAHGDGGPADGTFGGGHPIAAFYDAMARSRFRIVRDEDITAAIAPTLAIADDILMRHILPASETLARHLAERRPWLYRALRLLGRGKLDKLRRKYFSGHRSPETFLRYKTYRLIAARLQ
jgi:ubiquinone/menaquinone biosynthesis C-methylase UbiE